MTGNQHNLRLHNLQTCIASLDPTSTRAVVLRQSLQREISTDCTHSLAKSLDILRDLIQPLVTADIVTVLDRYTDEYLRPAIVNAQGNHIVIADDAVQHVRVKMLEQARQTIVPKRRPIEYGEPSTAHTNGYVQKASRRVQNGLRVPVKKERVINEKTKFMLGSRANMVLGLTQRGRIYAKHPRLFRYVGDNEDKTWLTRAGHSSRTAGKTYLLLVDDVLALCSQPPVLAARHTFTLPPWIVDKVRRHVESGGAHRRVRQTTVVRHSVSDTAAILRRLEADVVPMAGTETKMTTTMSVQPARQLSVIQETNHTQ